MPINASSDVHEHLTETLITMEIIAVKSDYT